MIRGAEAHQATGVATELAITKQEGNPYFFVWGRPNQTCTMPSNAGPYDKIYNWTWITYGR